MQRNRFIWAIYRNYHGTFLLKYIYSKNKRLRNLGFEGN